MAKRYTLVMDSENKEFDEIKKAYEEALSDVVIKLNTIEVLMEHIILEVIKPDRDNYNFIRTTFFNNSYLSFGSKFGLVRNILEPKGWKKNQFDPIHTLIRIRNTFAHSNFILTTSSKGDEGNAVTTRTLQLHEQKSGIVTKKNYLDLHDKFNEAYSKIYEPLSNAAKESRKIWEPNIVAKVTRLDQSDLKE